MRAFLTALLVLVALVVVLVGGAVIWVTIRGVSARVEPSRVEAFVARRLRHLAVPRSARDQKNPVLPTPEVFESGLAHFADHCAVCHANDGSGNTEIGRGLYPKAPDMRLADTQSLSDGELFYIIENGVRFTGMPGWSTGTSEGATASWHLVHFIRRLPKLTPDELDRMKTLNPKSPDELREEQERREFLEGTGAAPSPSTPMPRHKHPGGHDE